MQGTKTHEQQVKIIEKREKTDGADFEVGPDLKKSTELRDASARGQDLKTGEPVQDDDRHQLRGRNQESQHHKG